MAAMVRPQYLLGDRLCLDRGNQSSFYHPAGNRRFSMASFGIDIGFNSSFWQ
ncbi:hypothetical protein [Picosynechococcus sp. PCC 7117]|uniref:hypothetical protein n=1 Tax=Picosynechococcus sp. PCC 7117 TaxID=195498 RepID=UPI0030DC77BE